MTRNKQETIAAIESSLTVTEAAQKLRISRSRLYKWLQDNNLVVIRSSKLKVVEYIDASQSV